MSLNQRFIEELNAIEREKAREEDFKNELKTLKAKLDDLKHFRVQLDREDKNDLYNILERLRSVENSINRVNIPKRINVYRKLELKDATKSFLVWWFIVSILVLVAVSGGAVFYVQNEMTKIEEQKVREMPRKKWLIDFYKFQSKKNPKDTQNFIKKNPLPK